VWARVYDTVRQGLNAESLRVVQTVGGFVWRRRWCATGARSASSSPGEVTLVERVFDVRNRRIGA
jgi:hypothetical protein